MSLDADFMDAARCDVALWRLVHAEFELDRQVARGLARLQEEDLFADLGAVRARDFVREHIGIQESRARWLVRLGRQLNALPALEQALAERRISASHAIELGLVLNAATAPEERALWIDRAQGTSIREFRKLVREARAVDASHSEDDDPDHVPDGGWMSIPAPARVAMLWNGATDLARAAAGHHLSQGQCAEMIFAEYLSAVGTEKSAPDPGDAQRDARFATVIEAMNRPKGPEAAADSDLTDEPTAPAQRSVAEQFPRLDWQPPRTSLPPDCAVTFEQDPWKLGEALVHLSRMKQSLRYDIATALSEMQESGLWHELGFRSFAKYCEVRLGFGLRRAERLIRFKHGLDRFPLLKKAYLDGRISYSAALLLLPILHSTTEDIWVRWADGITFRELERVSVYASMYARPDADPKVLESWMRGLEEQGRISRASKGGGAQEEASSSNGSPVVTPLASTTFTGDAPDRNGSSVTTPLASTTFTDDGRAVPLGYALPPNTPRALPRISGIPADISLAPPELCVARIRFWLPADALSLAYSALQRTRSLTSNALLPTWGALELILVHFIQTHDNPLARKIARRHRIIARDDFQCLIPGCTSHTHLNAHHLEHKSQGGSDEDSNQATDCFGHHIPGVHGGRIDMGGYAPDHLITKLGINPRTGIAFAYYRGERRVSREYAELALAEWRGELWVRRRERAQRRPVEEVVEVLPL